MTVLTLFLACGVANAQTKAEVNEPSTQLIEATQEYKASSKELLSIQDAELNKATARLEELRVLVSEGLVAKAELETSEQTLATLRAQLDATKKQVTDSDHMIAQLQEEQELSKTQAAIRAKAPVKLVSMQYGSFSASANILRFSGASPWSIGGLGGVQSFFSTTFGRALPTSAVGQSAIHNQLRYDHRNAVDVALHPDSAEGKTLINYLQSQGIPFLAFRAAIPGVATGPHIHIGRPSQRL